jgi:hypothetical protein
MSVAELRAELFKLQKEFVGGRISTLKKHEVAQRLAVMKAALGMKAGTPVGEPAPPGPLPPREIPTASVSLDESTTVIKPLEPVAKAPPKPSKKLPKKETPALKITRVPPKVEVDDDDHVIHVTDVTPVPRPKKIMSKATGAPSVRKPKKEAEPAAEPKAPAVPAVIRLPGGVRPLDAAV